MTGRSCSRRRLLELAGALGTTTITGCLRLDATHQTPSTPGGTGTNGTVSGIVDRTEPAFDVEWHVDGTPMARTNAANTGTPTTVSSPDAPEPLWTVTFDADDVGALSVVDDIVFAGTEDRLYGLDAATGQAQWTAEHSRTLTAPAITQDGTVVDVRSSTVVGLDATTGDQVWTHDAAGGTSFAPTVHEGTAYVPGPANELRAVNLASGDSTWTRSIRSGVAGAPAIAADRIYVVSNDHELYWLERATGYRTPTDLDADVTGPVAVEPGTTYAPGRSERVYGLGWSDHEPEFSFSAGDDPNAVAFSRRTLATTTTDGYVTLYNTLDEQTQWRRELATAIQQPPIVTHDEVYVADDDGVLYAVSHDGGAVNWSYDAASTITTPPALANDFLVVADGTGTVHALASKRS